MVRLIFVSVILIFLSACSTKPVYLNGVDHNSGEHSVFHSNCNSACTKKVDEFIKDDRGLLDSSILPAFIHTVDGTKGGNNYDCFECVVKKSPPYFNVTWDSSYNIFVKSGIHNLEVGVNDFKYPYNDPRQITISTESGHNYFIGSVSISKPNAMWTPVVVDLTDGKVIFPKISPW